MHSTAVFLFIRWYETMWNKDRDCWMQSIYVPTQ